MRRPLKLTMATEVAILTVVAACLLSALASLGWRLDDLGTFDCSVNGRCE